ncbi:MAG: bifunctional glutamate N-acetyltransferase/amino-acid acetyltransferase ArgJ [Emergencia sp.]
MLKYIEGGVCAPQGFRAAGVHCGFRKNTEKKDLAMIVSDVQCSAAAMYTRNKVQGAPLKVTREHLADGHVRAVICNSGNANTCADNGEFIARQTCVLAAEAVGCLQEDIAVASTGVIGEEMDMEPFEKGIPLLAESLTYSGSAQAAEAIMTTDTVKKETAVSFQLGGKTCVIGGIAKGSGMIHPDMATLLAFFTTDAAVSPELLEKALRSAVTESFNQVSIDGDTSTNDMAVIMAGGLAGNDLICEEGEDFAVFCAALKEAAVYLAQRIAADGEGASRLLICQVEHADSRETARAVSRSVASSSLVKAAVFGEDANWGRVLCAVGYTPGDFSVENVDVTLSSPEGSIAVCRGSRHVAFDEEEASRILSEKEITVTVDLHQGDAQATAWGCDLTFDYVQINSAYRS